MIGKRLLKIAAASRRSPPLCRGFTRVACLQSGHNRWSKIRHDKGKNDAAKSKERTGLIQAVIKASKGMIITWGERLTANTLSIDAGPNPDMNSALAFAINSAKKAQVSKESIEKAIAKGQGKSLSGAALDNVLIEAMLPHGVAAILEGQTENKNRTLAEVKMIVQRSGGTVTPTAFCFEKKGKVWFKRHETIGVDEAMDEAIDAGAEEIMMEDGQLLVETTPELVSSVGQALQARLGLEVERSQILYDAKEDTLAKLDNTQALELQAVLDQLEDLDDLQEVYINAVIS